MKPYQLVLKAALTLLALLCLVLTAAKPLMFVGAESVNVNLLGAKLRHEQSSGYAGRGGRSNTVAEVSFDFVDASGKLQRGSCFSTAGGGEKISGFEALYKGVAGAAGQKLPAWKSRWNDGVCLHRIWPWSDLLWTSLLSAALLVLAYSPASPLNRSGRRR